MSDDMDTLTSEPFTLKGTKGWAQFPCAKCGEQLSIGDEVVMVALNCMQSHPSHVGCTTTFD